MVAALKPQTISRSESVSVIAPSRSRVGMSFGSAATNRFPQIHPVASAATSSIATTSGPYVGGRPPHRTRGLADGAPRRRSRCVYARSYPVRVITSSMIRPFPCRPPL